MFSENLQELVSYQPEGRVLSLYLDTNPVRGTIDDFKLRLRSLLKDIDMPDDIERVKKYFDIEHDWGRGQGVALFSNIEDEFFEVIPLYVDVQNHAYTLENPCLKPLISLLDTYIGFGVALIDTQGGRLFVFDPLRSPEEVQFSGEDVQRQKHGGGSQVVGRSRGVEGFAEDPDQVIQRNLGEAAEKAARFFKQNDVRRVLIGGTEKNVAAFQEMLPKSWQSLVVGTFPMSMNASLDQVRHEAWKLGAEHKHKREKQIIQTIITEAARGRNGLTRLEDILSAVKEGRVQTLVLMEDYQAEGYQCRGCGYLTIQSLDGCPFCSGEFKFIEDAAEMAIRGVMESGGDIVVVQEDDELEKHGGIGALLRY